MRGSARWELKAIKAPFCPSLVRDPSLAARVQWVLRELGLRQVTYPGQEPPVITDRPSTADARAILVVNPYRVATARGAIEAVVEGRAAGVVPEAELDLLEDVLAAAQRGLVIVPECVLAAARRAPQPTTRQCEVLRLLAQGQTTALISGRLHVSEATVKREIATLRRQFACASRFQLAVEAAQQGFVQTLTPHL